MPQYVVTTSFSRTLPFWLWLDDKLTRHLGLRSMFSTQRVHCDNVNNALHGNGDNAGRIQGVCIKIHTLTLFKVNFVEVETTWDQPPSNHSVASLLGSVLLFRRFEVQGSDSHYPPSMIRERDSHDVKWRPSKLFTTRKVRSDPESRSVPKVPKDLKSQGDPASKPANYSNVV